MNSHSGEQVRAKTTSPLEGCGALSRWLLPGLFVISLTAQIHASPAEQFGVGTRSRALAGTGAAYGSSPASAYTNPALLSLGRSPMVELGWTSYRSRLTVDKRSERDGHGAVDVGLLAPLKFGGVLADRVGLGLSLSTPGSVITQVKLSPTEKPHFALLATRAESISLATSVSLSLPAGWQVGVGTQLSASLRGSVAASLEPQAEPNEMSTTEAVSAATDNSLRLETAPILGVAWSATEAWRVGFVWRSALQTKFDIQVTVNDLEALVLPPINVAGLAQYDPAQAHLELTYLARGLVLSAAATWKRWSALERLIEATVRCPRERPDCGASTAPNIDAHDTITPRAAAELRAHPSRSLTCAFRVGYLFEMSPLNAQKRQQRTYDNSRHALTLGYSAQLTELWPLEASLSYQHHWLAPRKHRPTDDLSQASAPSSVVTSGSLQIASVSVGASF